jgi:hypothetical protein
VIAYAKGKRWGGRGVSFNGTAKGGTFCRARNRGQQGAATGRFHCRGSRRARWSPAVDVRVGPKHARTSFSGEAARQ